MRIVEPSFGTGIGLVLLGFGAHLLLAGPPQSAPAKPLPQIQSPAKVPPSVVAATAPQLKLDPNQLLKDQVSDLQRQVNHLTGELAVLKSRYENHTHTMECFGWTTTTAAYVNTGEGHSSWAGVLNTSGATVPTLNSGYPREGSASLTTGKPTR